MRERSVRIGGKLTLLSSPSSGTEIKLIVPGGIIFQKMTPSSTVFRDKNPFSLKRRNVQSGLIAIRSVYPTKPSNL